jgi:hypothetical protein
VRRQAKTRRNLPVDVIVTAIVCIFAFFADVASADSSLTPHTAEYKVKVSVVSGTLTTELRETPVGYSANHVIRPTGLSRVISRGTLSERSEFVVVSEGVRPRTYTSQDTISREKTDASIHFDWDTGEARGMVNGEDVVSVMDSIAHDRVSIQYQLMHDLLSSRSGSDYTMFEIDRLRPITVSNIGSRTVKVRAGEFDVIGIQHQAEGSKRRTTLWVAKELDYLPVVIEQHRLDKLKVRATLTRYTPASEPGSAR